MKKVLFSLLAVLLLVGTAHAANIPRVVDPQNGPELWLVPVNNNLGSQINANEIVVWDIANSTGDDDNYVTTSSTAATYLVAGVAYADIPAASDGFIVVRGQYDVEMATGCTEGGYIGTSGTAGSGQLVASTGSYVGVALEATAGTADCKVMVNPVWQ